MYYFQVLVLSLILFYAVYIPQKSKQLFNNDEFKDFEMVHFNLVYG